MATTTCSLLSLPSHRHTTTLRSCPNFIHPPNFTLFFPRLSLSCAKRKVFPVLISSSLVEDYSNEAEAEAFVRSTTTPGASIDLKLPRRSLLVRFTCNACGERSEKLISRLAYEKGTVFVQCTGCSQYHNLVDNLNLVVEYDLREDEINMRADTDQV